MRSSSSPALLPSESETVTISPAGRIIRRMVPYIWQRRWVLLLTFLCMGICSIGVNVRNLVPAIFFDGVLALEDVSQNSVIFSKLRPAMEFLGLSRGEAESRFVQKGRFSELVILEYESAPDAGAIESGAFSVENGVASYSFELPAGAADGATGVVRVPAVAFTRLSVHSFEPGTVDWNPNGGPQRVPSGELDLEHRPFDTNKWGLLRFLFVFGLSVCVAIALGRYFQRFLEGYLIQHVLADLRRDLIDHMCGLSLSFFNDSSRGDLLSRISSDLNMVTASLHMAFGDLFQKPITFLIALVVLFLINWWLALVVLVVYVALFFVIVRFGRRVRKRSHRQSMERGVLTTALEQLFSGIRTVKSFGMEEAEKEDFGRKNQALVNQALRTIRAKILAHSFVELAAHGGIILALGIGGYFLLDGRLNVSIGDLIAFVAVVNTMYTPVKSLAKAYTTFQESIGAMARVQAIFEVLATVKEAPGATTLEPFRSAIRFDNVSFTYGREQVLTKIDLEIPAGTVTAVVGPTGAGKSTLVDLLMRFYDPTEGRILIDDTDIKSVTFESLLGQISIVSQDPFLFDETVRENILYGRPDATQEEIEEAARMANIHDFIASLPDGYETRIGDRKLLSGGQRQRVTIARSLLKKSSILILDEATSSLDAEAEAAVQDALENLMRVRSTIAIAHRLSTVRKADNIVVLDGGEIVETGTYDELLARRGLFYKLYSKQFADGGVDEELDGRADEELDGETDSDLDDGEAA